MNTVRLWFFKKPVIIKNTTKFRANKFGFYSFDGKSTVNTYANSRQESVMDFLREIRYSNPFNHIIVILDNFSSLRTENVAITANTLDIELTWKSVKRAISRTIVKDQEMMIETVKTSFMDFSKSRSFCKSWIEVFVN